MARLGPNVWVVRRRAGYSVKFEGTRYCFVPPITQREAVRIARLLARANRSELFVQNRGGRIRMKDSHGSDPYPPKG